MSDFDFGIEADAPALIFSPADTATAIVGLIPAMRAWVHFAWDDGAERFRPTVVDAEAMNRDAFMAWKGQADAERGFVVPVCIDASDAHDQSRACFVAHSFSPGYADRTAALREFAKLAEAEWARELLIKETAA